MYPHRIAYDAKLSRKSDALALRMSWDRVPFSPAAANRQEGPLWAWTQLLVPINERRTVNNLESPTIGPNIRPRLKPRDNQKGLQLPLIALSRCTSMPASTPTSIQLTPSLRLDTSSPTSPSEL